jgi:hypothetical protein
LFDTTRAQQLEQLQAEPRNQRAVERFLSDIGSITTPKELIENFEVYSFVMRAFDLSDQIFGRGMMRRILEADPSDESSLVNRLTDGRFREIHEALGFTTADGPTVPNFEDPRWQQAIVSRYFDQELENAIGEQNSTVGTVLSLRRQVSELTSWFDVLKDREMTEFFRTALGLPEQMASVDLDRQRAIFEREFDLASLSDPSVLDRLITRYMAISDVTNPQSVTGSSALSILQNSSGLGVIVSLDVPQVPFSATSLYG